MRIVHGNEGFDIDGLYLALGHLGRLKITAYKVSYSGRFSASIILHRKKDYQKMKERHS